MQAARRVPGPKMFSRDRNRPATRKIAGQFRAALPGGRHARLVTSKRSTPWQNKAFRSTQKLKPGLASGREFELYSATFKCVTGINRTTGKLNKFITSFRRLTRKAAENDPFLLCMSSAVLSSASMCSKRKTPCEHHCNAMEVSEM